MYAPQSLHHLLFLMLYGGVAMIAFIAGLYLWLRRSNAIEPEVAPPKALRRWTAAFFVTAGMSHVWWYVLGVYWLADNRLVRNIICIMLDHITLVPLVIALLLRMLQDRQRRIWPWVAVQVFVIGSAAVGIATHSDYGLELMHQCQVGIIVCFITYYIYALVKYSRWLKDNYADLDHKEVWQSLLFVVVLCLIYEAYSTNPGIMIREYLSQVNTLIIIAFLLWRVETLQELEATNDKDTVSCHSSQDDGDLEDSSRDAVNNLKISAQLETCCEAKQLYLQHDLTLQQLALAIGTNRTYLSSYFAQQGITYNAYINRLRIEHFKRIYPLLRTMTATQVAQQSGFHSYSTFAAAFKQFNDQSFASWTKSQNEANNSRVDVNETR